MKYYKISEEDLLRLLRDSLTLREIQTVKPVSEDLAELELSKFHEVPEYIVPMPEKPFCFEVEQAEQEEQKGNCYYRIPKTTHSYP